MKIHYSYKLNLVLLQANLFPMDLSAENIKCTRIASKDKYCCFKSKYQIYKSSFLKQKDTQ